MERSRCHRARGAGVLGARRPRPGQGASHARCDRILAPASRDMHADVRSGDGFRAGGDHALRKDVAAVGSHRRVGVRRRLRRRRRLERADRLGAPGGRGRHVRRGGLWSGRLPRRLERRGRDVRERNVVRDRRAGRDDAPLAIGRGERIRRTVRRRRVAQVGAGAAEPRGLRQLRERRGDARRRRRRGRQFHGERHVRGRRARGNDARRRRPRGRALGALCEQRNARLGETGGRRRRDDAHPSRGVPPRRLLRRDRPVSGRRHLRLGRDERDHAGRPARVRDLHRALRAGRHARLGPRRLRRGDRAGLRDRGARGRLVPRHGRPRVRDGLR